jgi:hypothetical protein
MKSSSPDRQQDGLVRYGDRIDKKGFFEIRIGGKFVCLWGLGRAYACQFDRDRGEEFVGGR